jgi:glucokinase
MVDVFDYSVKQMGSHPFMGHRPVSVNPRTGEKAYAPYAWQSFSTISERRINFGSGLVQLYEQVMKENKKDKWHLGIYAVSTVYLSSREKVARLNALILMTNAFRSIDLNG